MPASRKPWDVLVTGASTRVAYSLVRSLARDGLRVGVGTDEHSGMAAYSRYCSGVFHHPSPERNPAGFVAAVREALRAHRPAVCIPADEEAFVLAEHRHLFDATSSRTALAPVHTLLKLDDTYRATELAEWMLTSAR